MMFLYSKFLMILIILVGILVGVAYLTLLERKLLGYVQIRLGPNKVSFMGILQPFSDAIKLFSKEIYFPYMSNYFIYYFSPVMALFLSLFIWMILPYSLNLFNFNYGFLFILCILSMGVYVVLLCGWSSNSNYAMLGALRAIAQTISYEVTLILSLMSLIFFVNCYNIYIFMLYQKYIWFVFMYFIIFLCWLSCALAETNRTPFDFAEGESELVSGFNIEYVGGGFAMIFLAEYSSILFMSMLTILMFLSCSMDMFFFYWKLVLISFIFIWIRGLMPRYRYDKLMYLTWKIYLPISLNLLLFYFGVKLIL